MEQNIIQHPIIVSWTRLLFDENTKLGPVFHILLYNEGNMSLSDVWVMFTAGVTLSPPTPTDNVKPSAEAKHGSRVVLNTKHSLCADSIPTPQVPIPIPHPIFKSALQ